MLDHFKLTREQLQKHIDFLRRHFTDEWVAKAETPTPNHLAFFLFGVQGIGPLACLLAWSRTLRGLEGARGLDRKIAALHGDAPSSTVFELQIASLFGQAGWSIEFIPRRDRKTPDVFALKGDQCVAVECKRLELQVWEKWTRTLSSGVTQAIAMTFAGSGRRDVEFNPRLSDLQLGERWPKQNESLISELVDLVAEQITQLVTKSPAGGKADIPGIATISFAPREGGGLHGRVGGIQVSQHAKARQVISNGVLRAAEQLKDTR